MVWNVLAIAIAASALLASSFLAVQQVALMSRANHIPVYLELFSEFRSLKFQDHCNFVINRLGNEFVAKDAGISGLPAEAREAVWDVGGLFNEIAILRLMGTVDRRVDSLLQVTLPAAWKALAPFIYEERRRLGVTNMFWRALEEFASDVASLPAGSINVQIERHRRTGKAWGAKRPGLWAARRSAPEAAPGATGTDTGPA